MIMRKRCVVMNIMNVVAGNMMVLTMLFVVASMAYFIAASSPKQMACGYSPFCLSVRARGRILPATAANTPRGWFAKSMALFHAAPDRLGIL